MSTEYEESVRKSALEWLDEIDAEAFAQQFIELERNACGPTVAEYLEFMNIYGVPGSKQYVMVDSSNRAMYFKKKTQK